MNFKLLGNLTIFKNLKTELFLKKMNQFINQEGKDAIICQRQK